MLISLTYGILLVFDHANDDEMACGRYGASNHTPFQWQRQHCVRHEYDEQQIPHQTFTIGKSDAVADEACVIACKKPVYIRMQWKHTGAARTQRNDYLVRSATAMCMRPPSANNYWQSSANSPVHKCQDWRPCSTLTRSPLPVSESIRFEYNSQA